MKFYSSVCLDIRRVDPVKDFDEVVGNENRVKEGFVDKSGAWYAYNGDEIGQGRTYACKFLEENMGIDYEIEARVHVKLMPKSAAKKEDLVEKAGG